MALYRHQLPPSASHEEGFPFSADVLPLDTTLSSELSPNKAFLYRSKSVFLAQNITLPAACPGCPLGSTAKPCLTQGYQSLWLVGRTGMEHSHPPRQTFWLTAWFEMTVLIPHSKSVGCKPERHEFGGQASM